MNQLRRFRCRRFFFFLVHFVLVSFRFSLLAREVFKLNSVVVGSCWVHLPRKYVEKSSEQLFARILFLRWFFFLCCPCVLLRATQTDCSFANSLLCTLYSAFFFRISHSPSSFLVDAHICFHFAAAKTCRHISASVYLAAFMEQSLFSLDWRVNRTRC